MDSKNILPLIILGVPKTVIPSLSSNCLGNCLGRRLAATSGPPALMHEGHTVVPYAFQQEDDERAQVLVYDPNSPPGFEIAQPIVTFDLGRDDYGYDQLAQLDEHATTVIAVRQSAYRNGRSAILASLLNLILFPRSIRESESRLPEVTLAAVLAGLLTIAVGVAVRRASAR